MSIPFETILGLLKSHPDVLLFPLVAVEGPLATICAGFLVSVGLVNWPVAYVLTVAADLTGDSFYYSLGRSACHPRASRWLARIGLTQERLAAMEAAFRRNDARALALAQVADFAAIPVLDEAVPPPHHSVEEAGIHRAKRPAPLTSGDLPRHVWVPGLKPET